MFLFPTIHKMSPSAKIREDSGFKYLFPFRSIPTTPLVFFSLKLDSRILFPKYLDF
jgi:hypothetical protein